MTDTSRLPTRLATGTEVDLERLNAALHAGDVVLDWSATRAVREPCAIR